MKGFFNVNIWPKEPSSYSYQHLYGILKKYIEPVGVYHLKDENQLYFNTNISPNITDLDYYFIIDNIWANYSYAHKLIESLKKKGTKVVVITYDPPNFKQIDMLIADKLVDLVITFDKRFANRFKPKTYISDYIFNEDFFPIDNPTEYNNSVCIYGNMVPNMGKDNRYKLPIIDVPCIDYVELYKRIQKYNGIHAFTTGYAEDEKTIVRYNKAKPIEALLCGRNPYCDPGLNYLCDSYNKYLKSSTLIPNPVQIDFDRTEMLQLNKNNIDNFIKEILYGI